MGNIVSGFFLLGCVLGILGLIKWAMEERMRRRRWSWSVEKGRWCDEAQNSGGREKWWGLGKK